MTDQIVIQRSNQGWIGKPHERFFDSLSKAKEWGQTVQGDVDYPNGFADTVVVKNFNGVVIDRVYR